MCVWGGLQKSLPKFQVYLEEHFTKNRKPWGICYVSHFPPCKGLLKLFFLFLLGSFSFCAYQELFQ